MASGKEIRTQIASIKNTQKITSAMEMVAASKMKKAQNRMEDSRPYSKKIFHVISNLTNAHSEFKHPYIYGNSSNNNTVGVIIISSDKGLCGGLNNNLFRKLLKDFIKLKQQGINVEICTIGKKAANFFKNSGIKIVASVIDLGDTPHYNDIIGSVKIMLDKFEKKEINKISLAYNYFVGAMTQQPIFKQILPVTKVENKDASHHWDYIYEPNAEQVLDVLLHHYIESTIYQALIENIACEQSARMIAMKSASDNASDMVDELALIYNKARQAAITQEISEIVSGAAAV